MKAFLLLLLTLISLNSKGQRFALLDRGWERPIRYVDTFTNADLKAGWYPIFKTEIDSMISIVDEFQTIFKKGMKRSNFNTMAWQSPSIEYEISNVQMAYGDRYDINIISNTGLSKVSMKLSNAINTNRVNQGLIKKFYYYLIRNKVKST